MGLWYLGSLPAAPRMGDYLSIVGARASTGAGNRCARNMAAYVASAGVTVVSGGAIGIDIEAHRGALSARGGTICVLAGGVSNPYPAAHGSDFRAVIEGGGALISEVPPTARPAKWRFLTRNRLIAAWSAATIVVEAGARSGALATARRTMEYGRELGAVPGAVDAAMVVMPLSLCVPSVRRGRNLFSECRLKRTGVSLPWNRFSAECGKHCPDAHRRRWRQSALRLACHERRLIVPSWICLLRASCRGRRVAGRESAEAHRRIAT